MKTIRVIRLPNGNDVSLGCYVASWKTLKTVPADAEIRGFGDWPMPAAEVLRELRHGLHDRINRRDPAHGKGRKWSGDWQRAVGHLAREVNTPRLIVRVERVMPEFRARLAHRVHDEAA